MRTTLLVSVTVAVAALGPVAAQVVASSYEETVEVTEVLLDVLVTDPDGRVILGLGPEDFVVEEKKRGPVDVTGVSFYSNRFLIPDDASPLDMPRPAANEMLADRYFILFFHDVKLLDEPDRRLLRQQFNAANESKRWIEEDMLAGDWVAVASWDVKLKIHQDFTQDREALTRAVDLALLGKDPANIWRPRQEDTATREPSLLRHLPAGRELRTATPRMYDALEVLAGATTDILGRKNVLLFTIGFGEIQSGFFSRPDPRFYSSMKRALNEHNVAIYPIDLTPPRSEHVQAHFLQQLANDTGGSYWDRFASFGTPLDEISDENNGYYLLSYSTEHPAGESGYQEVEVTTRDRSLRVRARSGYEFGHR